MFGDKGKGGRNGHAMETLIGPRVLIRGDVSFSGGLYVEGRIIGKVVAEDGAPGVLSVAEAGIVEGEVRAPVVVVCGTLRGDVHASERVELAANARVQGNIYYKVVEMAAGAMLTGRLIHSELNQADAPMAQLTGPEAVDSGAPVDAVPA